MHYDGFDDGALRVGLSNPKGPRMHAASSVHWMRTTPRTTPLSLAGNFLPRN